MTTLADAISRSVRRLLGLTRDPDAARVGALTRTHAVITAADACIAVSLAGSLFFSVSVDAARPRLALYLTLTLAPFAVVAPLIGPVTDRFGNAQRAFLAFTAQGRGILALFIALDLRNLLLYPESFGVLVLGKAFAVVKRSVVPTLVGSEHGLVAANARLSRVGSLAGVVGGGVGAALLSLSGPVSVLRVAAVLHIAGAALALRIPRSSPTGGASSEAVAPDAPTSPTTPNVRTGQAVMATLRIAAGLVTFVVAFALKRDGAPTIWFGIVALAATLASFAGTFVSPVLRSRVRSKLGALGLCAVAATAASIVAALQQGRSGMLIAASGVMLSSTAARHVFDSILQHELDETARPRAFARTETILQLVWVVGALVPTLTDLRAAPGYIVAALTCALAATLTKLGSDERR